MTNRNRLLFCLSLALCSASLSAQTIVQLETRNDFESTYRQERNLDLILISERGLELSRLLAAALAHGEATGDNGYRLFFESIRRYGDCLKQAGNKNCYQPTQSPPRFRSAAARDRFKELNAIYYNAFYRILQIQGRARISLQTRKLKPATEAFELFDEIMQSFSLNREHSIDQMTIKLLRRLPGVTLQPIPDASLYLIFLRSMASLPAAKLTFEEGRDLPANMGIRRVNRLKSFLRKSGLRQVLFRVPGSLRNLASNI